MTRASSGFFSGRWKQGTPKSTCGWAGAASGADGTGGWLLWLRMPACHQISVGAWRLFAIACLHVKAPARSLFTLDAARRSAWAHMRRHLIHLALPSLLIARRDGLFWCGEAWAPTAHDVTIWA